MIIVSRADPILGKRIDQDWLEIERHGLDNAVCQGRSGSSAVDDRISFGDGGAAALGIQVDFVYCESFI